MNKTRLEQIEEIYQAVADQPLDKRGALLDESCGDDHELRREVESLLRYDSASSNFIDSPPAMLAAEMFAGKEEKPELVGEQIGHYKIERLLGEGGMGEVYLAEDLRLHRRVALKVLPHSIVDDEERLMRFEREAQAASALNHPNILTVHEFGEDQGVHFLAAEFVDGLTLRHKLIAGPLDVAEALEIAVQTSSALSAAHEARITHRDIKPENIMVRQDGYVKVLDFGLAKLNQGEKSSTDSGSEDPTKVLLRTEPGVVMGTDAYMSPEQARGRQIDARSDIWSLGVVIYEMLTGQRPFVGETRADVIVSLLSTEPPQLSSVRQNIPAELDWIVSKALSKDLEGRYQNAKELRADLVRIKKQLEMHESTGQPFVRDPQTDAPNGGERIHSTVETGLRTSKGTSGETGEAGTVSAGPVSFWSSSGFASVLAQPKTKRVGYSVFAVALLAAVFSAAYFFIFAPKASAKIDSIAVLPFENLTGNTELNYVSDGLSEGLIDRLAQLPQLKVISRSSSFKFRGSDIDLRDVASKLGVRALVTGSVTKVGDDLVIRVDIVDAVEDRQLTGGQYRRRPDDILRVPKEIAEAAAEPLRLKLTDSQTRRLAEKGTENSDAYRYYLSGLVEANGPSDERGRALEYFQRAVELDPNFAAAHVEIAWQYWSRANGVGDPHELMPKVRAATDRALEIDPDLAKAYVLLASIKEYEFDWQGAEREYKRALELNPNLDLAHLYYSFFLSLTDRHEEGLRQLNEHQVRDPINRRLNVLQKAFVLVQAKRFDEALRTYDEVRTAETDNDVPEFALAYAYAGKGLHKEAIDHYRKAVALLGGEEKLSQPLVYLAAEYAKRPERRGEARALLTKIESMREYKSPALLAIVYAALNENDKAMELLEKAYTDRDLLLRYVRTGYEYDSLRGDPRFVNLMNRIGFSEK